MMQQSDTTYYKKDFWIKENRQYAQPHFRLTKSARLINRIAGARDCDLLDVGCGPATLQSLLRDNIHYYGIDIALHRSAPNLHELDFVEKPIRFGNKQFDIIIAQGVFEYIGRYQSQKFSEIARLLRTDRTFIASYVNFDHRAVNVYAPYNNIQSFGQFSNSLAAVFDIKRIVPTSHHWHHHEPHRPYMKRMQMHFNINIPLISRRLAVEYLFICSTRRPASG